MTAFQQGSDLEERIAHFHAQGLRLIGAGDGAAVIVAEHDNRLPVQFRTENPFAGSEEIVAVGQGEHQEAVLK